jgi:hypothetical protein
MGLTRELCSLKLVESQTAMQLEAARLHADALAVGSASLRRALCAAENRLQELESEEASWPSDAWDLRALDEAAAERFRLEERLIACDQALAAKDLELKAAGGRAKAAQAEAAAVREELAAGIRRLKDELKLEHSTRIAAMETDHLRAIKQHQSVALVRLLPPPILPSPRATGEHQRPSCFRTA